MKFSSKGPITDARFIELLKDAGQSALTGMIRVENGPIIKVIYFQKGSVSFASSNEKMDRLAEVLRRAGKLTAEQVLEAQMRMQPNVSLGKTLVELGYITPKDLLWGARAQVDAILHPLLFWDYGKYQITEGPVPRETIHLNLPVSSVIFEGIMKSNNRDWILEHVGPPEAVYALANDFAEQNQDLKLPVTAVASRLDGKRTLDEASELAGIDTFQFCKTIVALEFLDLVQPVHQEPEAETSEEHPLELAVEDLPENIHEESEKEQEPEQEKVLEEETSVTVLESEAVEPADEPHEEVVANPVTETDDIGTVFLGADSTETVATADREPFTVEDPEEVVFDVVEKEDEKTPASAARIEIPYEAIRPDHDLERRVAGTSTPAGAAFNWKPTIIILALAAVAFIGGVVYLKIQSRPLPPPAARPLERPRPKPQPPPPVPSPPPESTTPAPSITPPRLSFDLSSNVPVGLLREGKLQDAANSWKAQVAAKQKSGHSIQLAIACQEKTVQDTFQLLNRSEQFIILPLKYRGQNCYRVLYGQFPTREAALDAIDALPPALLNQISAPDVVDLSRVTF